MQKSALRALLLNSQLFHERTKAIKKDFMNKLCNH